MQLDLTDKETFALLNALVEAIENDRYPLSPHPELRQIERNSGVGEGTSGSSERGNGQGYSPAKQTALP